MASCDDPMNDDGDSDKSTDEAETPISRNKGKGKETEGGSGSKSVKKIRSRSRVWEHFTKEKEDNERAICNYCGKEMACATKSGTSSLKKHLNLACKCYQAWLAMVVGELALSWVESVAWRNFCNKTKLYVPHSRRTSTRDIVESFVKKKEAMKKILKENKQRLSLMTDIWLAPHTEWDDALVLDGKFMHFRCATHILNLIVKEGLMEIESSVNAICNAIYFVRSSTPRLVSFERHKKRVGPPSKDDWEAVERLV
ncbi:hypothetical protein N665_0273s0020 [Sinapis alba]|nr:hypothetical protein N665_0273s0020 [Sinapis alba]